MMSVQFPYPTKKSYKERRMGKSPGFLETSLFGDEYRGDGVYCIVGPAPDKRKWYAQVTVKDGVVVAVK